MEKERLCEYFGRNLIVCMRTLCLKVDRGERVKDLSTDLDAERESEKGRSSR